MAITGEAYGGAMLQTGWTNQNLGQAVGTLSTNLEDGAGPGGYGAQSPSQNSYIAWSMIPEDAISATNHAATNVNQLTRVIAQGGGYNTKVDFNFTTAGTTTSFFAGLYNAAGTQLALTAESHGSIVTNALTSLSWVAPVFLTAGTTYYVVTSITWSVQPILAGSTGASLYSMNANLTVASAPNSATGATAATPASPYVMSGMTGIATKLWVGLK